MKRAILAAFLFIAAPAAAEPVIDGHVHLWAGEQSLRDYETDLKRTGAEVAAYAAMWFGGPNQALQGNPAQIRAANDSLWALAEKHPNMVPVATVHPYDGLTALDELQRVAARGFRLLKIHPHTQKFDVADPRVLAAVKRAGDLGLVVIIDNANILPGDSEKLFNLALAAPKTKFVFAHMGGMNFRFWNILRAARTAKALFGDNIYFDISATTVLLEDSPINDEFVWTIRSVGIDKVMLGSDYPQYAMAQTQRAFDKLNLTPEEKRKIRFDNASALFGVKP